MEQIQWTAVKDFASSDNGDGLLVRVMKLALTRPRYSIIIGSAYKDQSGNQKQGARINVFISQNKVKPFEVATLVGLIEEAELWINTEEAYTASTRCRDEDAGLAKRAPIAKGGYQQQRPSGGGIGLKALKKLDKAAWEAKQAQKRAAENLGDAVTAQVAEDCGQG